MSESGTQPAVRISTHPLIGVVAVLLGTNISVTANRILTVALPDLRGILGVGIDEAAWIPSAIDGAQMFMGPISVALAAVFGHRRVLLISSLFYILSSLVSPLVPDWRWVIFWQIIRGLASGPFYPLCLGFVVFNLPKPWVMFGIAAYALDVLGSNHLSYILYAWITEHASWHWIFWGSVVWTSLMTLCIYFGMPEQKPLKDYHRMRWSDFIYFSAGLTFIFVGFEQGERCDWFNSGLINGLFTAGMAMLLCALVARWLVPNPLVESRFLHDRNVFLLTYLFTVYRISLYGLLLLEPLFLVQLHDYRPLELAPLAILTGIASSLAAPLVAVAAKRFDVRLIAAVGFAMTALGLFGQAHILSTWLRDDLFWWQMLIAIGHPIAFIPLTTIQVFGGDPNAPPNPVRSYTQGVYFQTIRLFATTAGLSVMQRFLLYRTHFWQTILASHANGGWQLSERFSMLSRVNIPNAPGDATANARALKLAIGELSVQAQTLSIADGFMILGCFMVSAVFVCALLKRLSHHPE